MPDESGGFTAREFQEAARRRDAPSRAAQHSYRASLAFLERLRVDGLLVRDGDRYYASPDLCAILDVPLPPPRIPLPPTEESGTRTRARWRPSLHRRDTQ